jgi:hypothetical protein
VWRRALLNPGRVLHFHVCSVSTPFRTNGGLRDEGPGRSEQLVRSIELRGGDQGGVVRLGHGSFSLDCQAPGPTSSFVPYVASSSQSSSQAFPLGRIEARP